MQTTIPKTGNRSAHGSYGPRSHPPQVTGSRQNQPTAVKRGKRIGSWTSNECNSWQKINDLCGSRLSSALVTRYIECECQRLRNLPLLVLRSPSWLPARVPG